MSPPLGFQRHSWVKTGNCQVSPAPGVPWPHSGALTPHLGVHVRTGAYPPPCWAQRGEAARTPISGRAPCSCTTAGKAGAGGDRAP